MDRETLKERIREVVNRYRADIVKMVQDHPEMSYNAVAREFMVTPTYVWKLCREAGVRRIADKPTTEEATRD